MNKNFGKFALIFVSVCATGVLAIYCTLLFALPAVVNSEKVISAAENKIAHVTPFTPYITGLVYKMHPGLSSELAIQSVKVLDHDNNRLFSADNIYLKFTPLSFYPKQIKISYIFADKTKFDKIRFNKSSKGKKKFKIKSIPEININKADIILNKGTEISVNDASVSSQNSKYFINFKSILKTNYLKHSITASSNGGLTYQNNILSAENFRLNIENSQLNINGKIFDNNKHYDFTVSGAGIPVSSIEEGFLFFIKQKKTEKNFIENFYNFSGSADINLRIANNGLNGNAVIKNLSAKTVKFSIPIILPKAEFKFFNDEIHAAANGKFGNEDVYTDLSVTNLFSPQKLVVGSVHSKLGEKFTKLYSPDIRITGKIDALVKYNVFNRNVTVEYLAGIDKNSNIYYRNSDLGLTDRNRRLYAKTFKHGNNLYLKNYDYSFVDNGKIQNILLGDGLFIKQNGKYMLDNITCKTNGEAPVSVTGSFGRYIDGGTFSGDLKYKYPENLLTGNIAVHNSRYKSFFVKNASIKADEHIMEIKAGGTFENSAFNCFIDMINKFEDKLTINNLNLHLDEYRLKRNPHHQAKRQKIKLPEKPEEVQFTIKNGKLSLGRLRYNKILLENLELTGNLKDNIVEFSMPDIDFADGKLNAYGTYGIDKHAADIMFSAENINSNLAADMIFDLKDQIQGYANASMHLKTLNKLEYIHAHTDFSIKDGALTKIGSTEFIIKKSKKIKKTIKFTLPYITNIDINRMKALRSNIDGCFDINNHKIQNIKMFSQHQYLSIFAEGNYNIRKQDANMRLWGKYNRSAQKGIRILFVPLSLITKVLLRPEYTKELYQEKLDMVPLIDAKPSEEENFTVRINGNLNDNSSIKVEFKSVR